MTFAQALRGVARVGVDSSAFVDYGEAAPRSVRFLTRVFDRFSAGSLEGVTTNLSLTEVLTFARNDATGRAEEAYKNLLRAVRLVPVSDEIALRAADLRTRYGLATPDAIQLATALEVGCEAFLTCDSGDFLRTSGEIRIIVPAKLTER